LYELLISHERAEESVSLPVSFMGFSNVTVSHLKGKAMIARRAMPKRIKDSAGSKRSA
jgi:hypothetical protein